jgi:hypothetical protein
VRITPCTASWISKSIVTEITAKRVPKPQRRDHSIKPLKPVKVLPP